MQQQIPPQRQRLRETRITKAIGYLKKLPMMSQPAASTYDLGRAAIHGERRGRWMPPSAVSSLGMAIGVELLRRGRVMVTRQNAFTLLPVSS